MSTMTLPSTTRPSEHDRRPVSPTLRLAVLVSVVMSFLAASAAPTPLYQHYDIAWHGTPLTTTLAFGAYALAVLAGLLTLGELSEHLGRRPVLLGALALQAVALLLFATAGSFEPLFIGRVVQGIAAGASLGVLGAAMIEAHPERGTAANATAPGLGTGVGVIAASLVVGGLPWPTHLIYLGLLAVLAVQAVALLAVIEATPARRVPLAALRPRVAVPGQARAAFLTAAPVLFSVWALAGFYGSLGPALTRQLAHSSSVALGGVALFVLAGVAAVTTLVLVKRSGELLMRVGVIGLLIGAAGTALAIHAGSSTGFFLATAVAGIGFGAGFQGGIRTVVPLVDPSQRVGLLSAVFTVSYLGLGAPSVLAGWLVSRGAALTSVATGYVGVLVVLAALALVGLLLTGRRGQVPAEASN